MILWLGCSAPEAPVAPEAPIVAEPPPVPAPEPAAEPDPLAGLTSAPGTPTTAPVRVLDLLPSDGWCLLSMHTLPAGEHRTLAMLQGACTPEWTGRVTAGRVLVERGVLRDDVELGTGAVTRLPEIEATEAVFHFGPGGETFAAVTIEDASIAVDDQGMQEVARGEVRKLESGAWTTLRSFEVRRYEGNSWEDSPTWASEIPQIGARLRPEWAPGPEGEAEPEQQVALEAHARGSPEAWRLERSPFAWAQPYYTPGGLYEEGWGPVLVWLGGVPTPLQGLREESVVLQRRGTWLVAGHAGRGFNLYDLQTGQVAWPSPGTAYLWPDEIAAP